MDKKMIFLISLISELSQKIEVSKFYSKKFENGNKYLSPTQRIRIENLTDNFVTAGIVARDEILPIITKDGYQITEFEPDVIGGQFHYSADDTLTIKAGVPTFTKNGTEIPAVKEIESKYARIIAAAITNRFEKQCSQAYLLGTYTDRNGQELIVGAKENTALTWDKKVVYSDEILKLALNYQARHGVFPEIEVGETIFNALKNEAQGTNQNINNVRFEFSDTPTLSIGGKKVTMLVNAKDTNNNLIDVKDMIILSLNSNLALGYGCLTYGDKKANESKLVRAELLAGELEVETTTGSKGIWGKSAPMPIVLSTKKFERYTVTIK